MESADREITAFIDALAAGNDKTLGNLFSAAYDELRNLARGQRSRWNGQHTLCTTVLVHETYLKLSEQNTPLWHDRGHFFRVAGRAMRHILINYAQRSHANKRGGASVHVSADDAVLIDHDRAEELLALDEALTRLAHQNPRWARVVEWRLFAGLNVEETAEALNISTATVKRDWRHGQAWLFGMMKPD